jgi:hypothetical protein
MKTMKPKRYTIDMLPAEAARLTEIAERCECRATTGATVGQPSWRALLRNIASGRITCRDRLKGGGR